METAAFTPTNGHYWDPIATHHTTGPKCVYFQVFSFQRLSLFVYFDHILFIMKKFPEIGILLNRTMSQVFL